MLESKCYYEKKKQFLLHYEPETKRQKKTLQTKESNIKYFHLIASYLKLK